MPELIFLNNHKKQIELSKDKIIIIDFWSTFCGVCYEKFPIFEKLYQDYKNDLNIEFYAAHVSFRNDKFENVTKLLDEYNYSFKKIYSLNDEEIETKLGVKVFPTILIIKNNVIRYRGSLITDNNIIFGNTVNQIEFLLNE